jgi:hypothetical protein
MNLAIRRVAVFLLSAVSGAVCGTLIVIFSWGEPLRVEDLSFYPMALFWGAFLSFPYVGAGLALLGLPVTWLLHRHAERPWFGLLAAIWGGVAGYVTHLLFNRGRTGEDELGWIAGIEHIGVIYGVPTGLAWWLLYRLMLRNRELA